MALQLAVFIEKYRRSLKAECEASGGSAAVAPSTEILAVEAAH